MSGELPERPTKWGPSIEEGTLSRRTLISDGRPKVFRLVRDRVDRGPQSGRIGIVEEWEDENGKTNFSEWGSDQFHSEQEAWDFLINERGYKPEQGK